MRITTVISRLKGGGAERRLVFLAQWLARHENEVTLLTRHPFRLGADFYDVPKPVRLERAPDAAAMDCSWRNLACQRERRAAWRKALLDTEPDVVVSFGDTTNVHTLLALDKTRVPVIVSERTDPRFRTELSRRWQLLRRFAYPKAAAVVMVAEEALPWAQAFWPRWNALAIPNPVEPPPPLEEYPPPSWLEKPCLVAMGRLVELKGFAGLIRCFAALAPEFPKWRLYVLGEGPQRPELEKLVRSLGLEKRILLPGTVNPPWSVLHYTDVFALSSKHEGFPNALCEAMACGVACVSFDCPSGPGRIIRHTQNGPEDGLLVPDQDFKALTEALRRLFSDAALRKRLGTRAREITQRYDVARIMGMWQELLQTVWTRRGL